MSALRDMLTEDEAKTRWCPLVQVGKGANRPQLLDEVSKETHLSCIASECMFWRWSHQDVNGTPTGFCGGAGLPKYL
jgi:hypothetical protein